MIGVRTSTRFKTTSSKKSVGFVFQKMNKDNKQLFGDLVETNKVRKKRLEHVKNNPDDKVEKENNYLLDRSEIKPTTTKALSTVASSLHGFGLVDHVKRSLNEDEHNGKFAVASSETIVHEALAKRSGLPSVTNILNITMSEKSKAALENWKRNMIEKLGEDGFNKYSRELMAIGSAMHCKIQSHLTGCQPDVSSYDEVENCWKSLKTVLKNVSKPILVEQMVVHNGLSYKGIVDCVAFYKHVPVVIEWKKSSRDKSSLHATYDAPIQLAAYMGAVNNDVSYDFKVEEGLVVVAYSDGHPANVFKLTKQVCLDYWTIWIQRLYKYQQIQRSIK